MNSHADLNQVIERLSKAWGFKSFLINCQQRVFFTCNKCGAMAIHFLQDSLFGTLLPGTRSEADACHDMLRGRFVTALKSCQVTLRPWVWGSGDDESSEQAWPSEVSEQDQPIAAADVASSSADPAPGVSVPLTGAYDPTRSHTCIPLEDRIELLRAHGHDMADDEIRFHLQVIIGRRNEKRVRETLPLPVVLMFEPLNFLNWMTWVTSLRRNGAVLFPRCVMKVIKLFLPFGLMAIGFRCGLCQVGVFWLFIPSTILVTMMELMGNCVGWGSILVSKMWLFTESPMACRHTISVVPTPWLLLRMSC